ncbi:MAG: VWA domain-containing protein [Pyrinomonadaceae bacterium]
MLRRSRFGSKSLLVRCVNLACALIVVLLLLVGARGQQSPDQTERPRRVHPVAENQKTVRSEDEDTIRVDTDLVLVDVTVNDAAGRQVRGLQPSDFKLYEDNVERPVTFFDVEKRTDLARPLAVVFALDLSGSMTPEELMRLREAVRAFVEKLSERQTLFAVISFGMDVRVRQSFTKEREKLERAFDQMLRDPNGLSTHAYDAVDDAVRLLARKAPRTLQGRAVKRAVVVITDGFPVGDTVSPQTVIERANQSEVSVYTVTLPSYSHLLASIEKAPLPTPLDVSGLAEKTGGRNVFAMGKDYEPLFRALAEEVTSSYVLAFYPSEVKRRDGQFHQVRVEGPRGLMLRQNQTGYLGERR